VLDNAVDFSAGQDEQAAAALLHLSPVCAGGRLSD
jgi:hypothetical protein